MNILPSIIEIRLTQAARRQLIEQVSSRVDLVLLIDSAELREQERAAQQLRVEISKSSMEVVIERVAYNYKGAFLRLVDGQSEEEKSRMMREAIAQA